MNNELNNAYEAYVKRLKLERFLVSHGYEVRNDLTRTKSCDTMNTHNNKK